MNLNNLEDIYNNKENEIDNSIENCCKGIDFKKLRNLINENGQVVLNGKYYGHICNNGTNVFIRTNNCSGININKSGICEDCYRTYRNNLKKPAYIKDKSVGEREKRK